MEYIDDSDLKGLPVVNDIEIAAIAAAYAVFDEEVGHLVSLIREGRMFQSIIRHVRLRLMQSRCRRVCTLLDISSQTLLPLPSSMNYNFPQESEDKESSEDDGLTSSTSDEDIEDASMASSDDGMEGYNNFKRLKLELEADEEGSVQLSLMAVLLELIQELIPSPRPAAGLLK